MAPANTLVVLAPNAGLFGKGRLCHVRTRRARNMKIPGGLCSAHLPRCPLTVLCE